MHADWHLDVNVLKNGPPRRDRNALYLKGYPYVEGREIADKLLVHGEFVESSNGLDTLTTQFALLHLGLVENHSGACRQL